jgi:hypothetical protein
MPNMMAAYRLAKSDGVILPHAAAAPVLPQTHIDQVASRAASPVHLALMQVQSKANTGIYMFDSTNPQSCKTIIDKLGLTTYLVGAYVDGYGGYAEAVALFGKDRVVSISVDNNPAMCADVEPGAMTVEELPGWRDRQIARGIKRPVVYSDASTYPQCLSAVGSSCSYWTATASGQLNQVLPGRDAVQDQFDGSYDESWVLPTFPFYPAPVSPPVPWPLQQGSTGPDVVILQQNLNRWKLDMPPLAPLVTDGSFGPLTKAAVQNALAHWNYSAAKVAAGVVDEGLWNDLAASLPAVTVHPATKTIAGVTVTYSDGTKTTL